MPPNGGEIQRNYANTVQVRRPIRDLSDEKNADVRIKEELENNIFSKFYEAKRTNRISGKPLSDVGEELRRFTHSDAINFAAISWTWTNSPRGPKLKKSTQKAYALPTFMAQDGLRAYYRVVAENVDGTYVLIACHANVHGFHRGDLLFVTVDDRTVLKGYETFSVLGKLFHGDVVAVTKLAKIANGPLQIPNIFDLHDGSECAWAVHSMTLLSRKTEQKRTFCWLPNGIAVVIGYNEPMLVGAAPSDRLDADIVYEGDVFLPALIAFPCTEETDPKFENEVLQLCSKLVNCSYKTAMSTIYTFRKSEKHSRMFLIGARAFERNWEFAATSILEICVLLGNAGFIASGNVRIDSRGFPMIGARVEGRLVRFSIDNPMRHPTEGLWNCNARVAMTFGASGVTANGVIETVLKDVDNRRLDIAVRISGDAPKSLRVREGANIVFQRGSCENSMLPEGFVAKTDQTSNGYKIMKALYGGPAITSVSVVRNAEFTFPSSPPIELDQDQNQYVSMILAGNIIVLGNAAFGCGKSMAMVTAAMEVHRRKKRDELQLLLTQSNYASVNLVDIAKKAAGFSWNVVRFVTSNNWNELPDDCRTDYDLPVLMEKLFVAWARGEAEYSIEKKTCCHAVSGEEQADYEGTDVEAGSRDLQSSQRTRSDRATEFPDAHEGILPSVPCGRCHLNH